MRWSRLKIAALSYEALEQSTRTSARLLAIWFLSTWKLHYQTLMALLPGARGSASPGIHTDHWCTYPALLFDCVQRKRNTFTKLAKITSSVCLLLSILLLGIFSVYLWCPSSQHLCLPIFSLYENSRRSHSICLSLIETPSHKMPLFWKFPIWCLFEPIFICKMKDFVFCSEFLSWTVSRTNFKCLEDKSAFYVKLPEENEN